MWDRNRDLLLLLLDHPLHISEKYGGLDIPSLQKLGLGNIATIKGVNEVKDYWASYGIMTEASKGKDTIAGHWELMGIILDKPFALFSEGFPDEVMIPFLKAVNLPSVLGNCVASGTEIIKDLGDRHLKTKLPIVYTSADSVFQIAAHERITPPDKLYQLCEKARTVCDRFNIGRVIARPFIGKNGEYERTENRKDFPIEPPYPTALNLISESGAKVTAIGKISNIFAGAGITRSVHTKNNSQGMAVLKEELAVTKEGLIFINLIDFDMIYGHRNDAIGYAKALQAFDLELGELLNNIEEDDLVIITADHGCDPTWPGTDHTRERVPLLAYSRSLKPRNLGERRTFADVGATLLAHFNIEHTLPGTPF